MNRRLISILTATSIAGLTGCSSGVAPSKTATGAGTGGGLGRRHTRGATGETGDRGGGQDGNEAAVHRDSEATARMGGRTGRAAEGFGASELNCLRSEFNRY